VTHVLADGIYADKVRELIKSLDGEVKER